MLKEHHFSTTEHHFRTTAMLEQYYCRRLRYVAHPFCAPRIFVTRAAYATARVHRSSERRQRRSIARHFVFVRCAWQLLPEHAVTMHSLYSYRSALSAHSARVLSARDSAASASALLSALLSTRLRSQLYFCLITASATPIARRSAFYTADPNKHQSQYTL